MAKHQSEPRFRFVNRLVAVLLSILLVLVGLFVVWREVVRYHFEHQRVEWKTATLPRLAQLSLANEEIALELEMLKANRSTGTYPEWTGEQVLLMKNNEYLIFAFRHGFNTGLVDHLFLARGSDGRWLYSTYHFCGSMVGVLGDEPPSSIAEFAKRYSAREFDGTSDECLQHTWPLDV